MYYYYLPAFPGNGNLLDLHSMWRKLIVQYKKDGCYMENWNRLSHDCKLRVHIINNVTAVHDFVSVCATIPMFK